jgi:cysteine desulfurase/selenocysteine lyase
MGSASMISRAGLFDVKAIREQFPCLKQDVHGKPLVYLDNAASTQSPQCVLDALIRFYQRDRANVHRGVHELSQRATAAYEAGRESVRSFIGARHSHEVVFVRGTTEAINLVAHGFERSILQPDDEIIVSEMEHHSNIVPWQLACETTGAKLRVIPVTEHGELDMAAYAQLLGPQTKLVSVVHVSNALGTVNPVEKIIELAHQQGVPVLLDGAQAVGHGPVDVQALDADFYVFSGHKVYGPTGIGVLYGKESWLERLPPYQGGGDMIKTVSFSGTTFAELPAKLEAGTPNIAGVIGLNAALDFMQRLDRGLVLTMEAQILKYAEERLTRVSGLRTIGTARDKIGICSFVIEGTHPHDIGTLLDAGGVAIRTGHHCAQPLMERFGLTSTARASFAVYTTEEEIDVFVDGLLRAKRMLLGS